MDYLKDIEDNFFYGIDFDNGTINSFKRFDNDNRNIINAYNVSEKLDTFALIKCLYIEFFILKCNFSKTKLEEDRNLLYNDFRSRVGISLAVFTNDLLKKIGRSIDIDRSSKLFEIFDSVGDALIYIYKLCMDEFKEYTYVDEKKLKMEAIHGYLKLVQNHFERHSDEFNRSMEQYKKLFNLINQSSFDEFLDTFRKAYYELLKDIENINIKGNVK